MAVSRVEGVAPRHGACVHAMRQLNSIAVIAAAATALAAVVGRGIGCQGNGTSRATPSAIINPTVNVHSQLHQTPRWGIDGDTTHAAVVRHTLEHGLDTLASDIVMFEHATSATEMRRDFRWARRDYKQIEGLLEFYSPLTAMALNGPIEQENDDSPTNGRNIPKGFQLLEQYLFPTVSLDGHRHAIMRETAAMREAIQQFREITSYVTATIPQLLELTRLEIARVSTLEIAGFDAPGSGDGIIESAAALDGVRHVLNLAALPPVRRIDSTLAEAVGYLQAHPDFQHFDRFAFITQYANPAAQAIGEARQRIHTPQLVYRRVWIPNANSVFDANAFDARAYASDEAPPATPALVALGRELFFDPVLSGNGDRACASCHHPERAFTDGLPRAIPFATQNVSLTRSTTDTRPPTRHTPSLLNAAYQPAFFDDERAASLEQQVEVVLASPAEMHSSLDTAARRVQQSAEYRSQFSQALGMTPDKAVTKRTLRIAIAAYVRSLTAMHSRFDRAIRGEPNVLQPAERRGFNLFMGKAGCGTCHFAPFFNGTTPPLFTNDEVEIIGVPERPATHGARLDPDSGRGAIDRLAGHLHAFKTPTVRNATLTAPYMHNGIYRTLDQVVDFYNRGGGAGIGARDTNQTLDPTPLHLTIQEQHDIIAFLGALVDTVGMTGRPTRLPRFDSTKRLNDRPIGGRY